MLKVTLIYGLGTAVNRGILLVYLPIVSSYLSLEDFGIFSLFFTVAQILFPIVSINGSAAIVREGSTNFTLCKGLFTRFSLFSIGNGIVLSIFAFLLDSTETKWIFLVCVFSIFESIFFLFISKLRAQDCPWGFIFTIFVKSLILVSSVLISVSSKFKLIDIFRSNILYFSIFMFFLLTFDFLRRENFSRIYLERSVLLFCILLIPHQISQWIMSSSNRLILKVMIGDNALGIYSIATTIAMIIMLANSGIALALPQYFINNRDRIISQKLELKYIKYYSEFVIFLFFILISVLYINCNVYTFLRHVNFKVCLCFLFIYAGFYFLGIYYFFSNHLFYHRLSAQLSKITFYTSVINICLSIVLIFCFKEVGAAIGTFLSYYFYYKFVKHLAIKIEPYLINYDPLINMYVNRTLFFIVVIFLIFFLKDVLVYVR